MMVVICLEMSDFQTILPPAAILIRTGFALPGTETSRMVLRPLNLKDNVRSAHFSDTFEAQCLGAGPHFIDMHVLTPLNMFERSTRVRPEISEGHSVVFM